MAPHEGWRARSRVQQNTGAFRFGMGFSTTSPSVDDALFIAGGTCPVFRRRGREARPRDVSDGERRQRARVPAHGTGSGDLWGFSRNDGSHSSRLDKTPGATPTSIRSRRSTAGRAWAFAFHGGSFWVFLRKMSDGATTVYQINASNGQLVGSTPAAGRTIVGAGVSTCAPVIL